MRASAASTSRRTVSTPSACLRSTAMERRPRSSTSTPPGACAIPTHCARSTFTISAPRSESSIAANGPWPIPVSSTIFTPDSGPGTVPPPDSRPDEGVRVSATSLALRSRRPARSLFADMTIRVVLAEDNYLVREGLARLLETQDALELVATCGDLDELLAIVESEKPDVVITDIRIPPTGTDEGVRAANELRSRAPETGVVVLSQYVEPGYALALLEEGSEGRAYLLKERVSDIGQLRQAIDEVARGGSVIDPKVVEVLVEARTRSHESPLRFLTPREHEVLAEMAQGRNNAGIADALGLSERAVEKHINSVFAKLALSEESDSHRRVKAVLLYLSDQG